MQCPICHGIHYFQSILYLRFQRGTRKCACHSLFKSLLNTLKNLIRHLTGCLEVEDVLWLLWKTPFTNIKQFLLNSKIQINKFLIWNECNMYSIVIDQKTFFHGWHLETSVNARLHAKHNNKCLYFMHAHLYKT